MKVLDIIENDDGSATVSLDLTKRDYEALVELGFNALLANAIKLEKNELENILKD